MLVGGQAGRACSLGVVRSPLRKLPALLLPWQLLLTSPRCLQVSGRWH